MGTTLSRSLFYLYELPFFSGKVHTDKKKEEKKEEKKEAKKEVKKEEKEEVKKEEKEEVKKEEKKEVKKEEKKEEKKEVMKVGGLFHSDLKTLLPMYVGKMLVLRKEEQRIGGLVLWKSSNNPRDAVWLRLSNKTYTNNTVYGQLVYMDYNNRKYGMRRPHTKFHNKATNKLEKLLHTVGENQYVVSVWYEDRRGNFSDFQLGVTGSMEVCDNNLATSTMQREFEEETGYYVKSINDYTCTVSEESKLWYLFVQKL